VRPCTMIGQGKLTLQSCSATSVRLCTSSLAETFTPKECHVNKWDETIRPVEKKGQSLELPPHTDIHIPLNPRGKEEEDEEGIRCSMHRRVGS
jgi:hypothetical protein